MERLEVKINELEVVPGKKQEIEMSNFNTLVDKMVTECSESISAMKQANMFLFRGIKSDAPGIFLGKPRPARKPLDSKNSIQKVADEVLSAKGFTALRSNSIFCTSMHGFASGYGKLYVIFPVNGFSYTWSPDVDDLTSFLTDVNDVKSVAGFKKLMMNDSFMDSYYNSEDLFHALKYENEILINGQYYAFEYRQYGQQLSEMLGIGIY